MARSQLRAGELRHSIRIVQPNNTQDSFGGTKPDDASVFATVWASVEALSGRELFAAQQKVSQVTHKITMRYLPGVVSSMNVWFDGRQFEILYPDDPDETKKKLELLCVEIADSQYQVPA